MNKRRINIIILALFHLMVLSFPCAIKEIHHHETNYLHIYQAGDVTLLSKAEKPCSICQFEFFSFIGADHLHYVICQPVRPIDDCYSIQKGYIVPFSSYLLRAPPLA